jgi:hypothetical protein
MPAPSVSDQGKEQVVKLCRYFTTNRDVFLASGVKEAHVRQNLIDPLFEALGSILVRLRTVTCRSKLGLKNVQTL